MTYTTRQLALIIFVSIVLICIPIIGSPEFNNGESMMQSFFFQRRFTASILVVIFFYFNYFYFIPKFYLTKKNIIYFLIVLVCFIIVIKIPELLIPDNGFRPAHFQDRKLPMIYNQKWYEFNFFRIFSNRNTYQFIISFCISILLRLNIQMSTINDEKLKSEISYLKAQINPHFLFNTLNSIFALSLEKSDQTPDAIVKLSSIMRYVVTESSNEFVALEKEMIYVKDYIDLQKLRMVESTDFNLELKGDFKNNKIAPLLLIPFIENAFKYGLNPEKKSSILIHIELENDLLTLEITNSKTVKILNAKQKTETGLENTIKRIKYIYPNKQEIKINETDDSYYLQLKLNLK